MIFNQIIRNYLKRMNRIRTELNSKFYRVTNIVIQIKLKKRIIKRNQTQIMNNRTVPIFLEQKKTKTTTEQKSKTKKNLELNRKMNVHV